MRKTKLKAQFDKISVILIAVIIALIAVDLITKYFEEANGWNCVIIPGIIKITGGVRNNGCAFGILNDHPNVGQPILITVTFIMLAGLIFAFIFLPGRFVFLRVAVSLVIAGALGNLYDRIFIINPSTGVGTVRDWIIVNMIFSSPVCNLADFWIVIGAVCAVLDLLFFNEWAVFPLTKSAKDAQARRKAEEEAEEEAIKLQQSGEMPREDTAQQEAQPQPDGGEDTEQ